MFFYDPLYLSGAILDANISQVVALAPYFRCATSKRPKNVTLIRNIGSPVSWVQNDALVHYNLINSFFLLQPIIRGISLQDLSS